METDHHEHGVVIKKYFAQKSSSIVLIHKENSFFYSLKRTIFASVRKLM